MVGYLNGLSTVTSKIR